MDLHEYIQQQIKDGYILKDGTPVKCACGNTEFEMVDAHYCPYGLEEYQLKCEKCQEIVGHWAFGNWQVY